MNRQIHGVIGLLVVVVAVFLGVYAIWLYSVKLALLYIVLALLLSLILVYAFCAKCPCRKHACGHVFPGKLTAVLPGRKPGKYTSLDYIGVAVPLAIIVLFPQYWLRSRIVLFTAFWVILILACAYIYSAVCHGCGNNFCPLRKNSR